MSNTDNEMYDLTFFEKRFPLVIKSLRNVRKNRRLSHAYIVYSDNAEIRKSFAFILAQIILCSELDSDVVPCLKCSSCLKIMEGLYPDIYTLEPTSKSRQIVIGQDVEDTDTVRWFQARFSLSSMAGLGGKIGIIHDADRITVQAQNAFLKTLEEPPKGSFFILTSGNPHTLLPTVISRCQLISLITNKCSYEFSCCSELYDLLNSMILPQNISFSFAVEASAELLKMFDSLRKEAEESTKEKWAKRLAELEYLESATARKRITTRYDAAVVAEYRLLREHFLSAVHSWFAQVFQLTSGIDFSFLANPEIVQNYLDSEFKLMHNDANRMLGQVERFIKNLKWNINEQLAVQEFCINLVVKKRNNYK